MANKKQGHVNRARHLIGDRTPIVKYLGVGVVITLAGCDADQDDYFAFTDMNTCESTLPGQCVAAYKEAEKQAMKTALKYMVEDECNRDFGKNVCVENDGVWTPRMAGFITHKDEGNDFSQPFFTTFNPTQSLYGKGFMADGREVTDLRDMDGLNLRLGGKYAKNLPESQLERTAINIAPIENPSGSYSNSSSGSLVNTAITAYVLSEVVDEVGDVLTEREKTKRYRECMQKGYTDCNKYGVSSGTARIGKTNSTSDYKYRSKLETKATKTQSTYKQQKAVKTKSSGGFGKSGRSFGGFGG